MEFAHDQVSEMKMLFGGGMKLVVEGQYTFIFIPNQKIPGGVDEGVVDLLFCPTPWGGYNSRLFYSRKVETRQERNWNNENVRIIERNWFAFSWQVPVGLTLAETIIIYLGAAK